jgi:hypothetical protein
MIPLGVIPLIAKIPEKRSDGQSSFRDLVDYCRKGAEYTNSQGIREHENAAKEMEIIASINDLCADPVFHFMLSWRETEFPTPEQTDEAVAIALKELGLQDCQAFWALQSDTDNRMLMSPSIASSQKPEELFSLREAGQKRHLNARPEK